MRGRTPKLLLAALSTLLASAVFVTAFELVQRQRYAAWKASYVAERAIVQRITIASPDPQLVWEYRPNASYQGDGFTIRTNSRGFRDDDWAMPKPAGVDRVAIVGDSVALGYGVSPEDGVVDRVERLANAKPRAKRVETLDMAIDGYSGLQVMRMAETRALAQSPDRVVYLMCLNDFDLVDAADRKRLYYQPPASFFLYALRGIPSRLTWREYHFHHFSRGRDRVMGAIAHAKHVLAAKHVPLDVAVVPIFDRKAYRFNRYRYDALHHDVDAALAAIGIEAVDTLAAFRKADIYIRGVSIDIWHPNPEGHRILAEALTAALFD